MLTVNDLCKRYSSGVWKKSYTQAVAHVSFHIEKGKVLGIVGESGSGKSTIAQCITRLVEPSSGEIIFRGEEITRMKAGKLNKYRRNMQMIFQDPDSALDPKMTISESLEEALKLNQCHYSAEERKRKTDELIALVGLNAEHKNHYPHQLSGGQNQRVVLARALSFDPELLIADEPTASLDVSVQAQILTLLKTIQREKELTMLLISHDMEIVRRVCDEVIVMYRGEAVEKGRVESVFGNPQHVYTRLLLDCNEENVKKWIDYKKEKGKRGNKNEE